MLERDIERRVVEYCRREGLACYKFSSPAHRGVPDRLIVGRGTVMFLELKRPGQKPTALQLRELDRLSGLGVRAAWADNYPAAVEMIADHFVTDIV